MLKGTGKGLVGLIVRPTGGLVDLASGTLSFVSRYSGFVWCVCVCVCVCACVSVMHRVYGTKPLCIMHGCRKTQVGNIEITDIRPPRFIGRDGVSFSDLN